MEDSFLDENFATQFKGSASANLVFVIGFFIMAGLKKLCTRNSRCHSKFHSCCLEVEVDDRTLHEIPKTGEV